MFLSSIIVFLFVFSPVLSAEPVVREGLRAREGRTRSHSALVSTLVNLKNASAQNPVAISLQLRRLREGFYALMEGLNGNDGENLSILFNQAVVALERSNEPVTIDMVYELMELNAVSWVAKRRSSEVRIRSLSTVSESFMKRLVGGLDLNVNAIVEYVSRPRGFLSPRPFLYSEAFSSLVARYQKEGRMNSVAEILDFLNATELVFGPPIEPWVTPLDPLWPELLQQVRIKKPVFRDLERLIEVAPPAPRNQIFLAVAQTYGPLDISTGQILRIMDRLYLGEVDEDDAIYGEGRATAERVFIRNASRHLIPLLATLKATKEEWAEFRKESGLSRFNVLRERVFPTTTVQSCQVALESSRVRPQNAE
jgi:hypothetical protein